MVRNDWESCLNAPNLSEALPNCPKISQSPLPTHPCPNRLVAMRDDNEGNKDNNPDDNSDDDGAIVIETLMTSFLVRGS